MVIGLLFSIVLTNKNESNLFIELRFLQSNRNVLYFKETFR